MTQEEKSLLLKDISARLPYRVKVSLQYGGKQLTGVLDAVYPTEKRVIVDELSEAIAPNNVRCGGFTLDEDNIKLYLRPLSSMTEEEKEEFENLLEGIVDGIERWDKPDLCEDYDWLNAHQFDYRNLIEKDLALEAPEGLYELKEK